MATLEQLQCTTCHHSKHDHIYEEGACRPGFVCEQQCEAFTSDKFPRSIAPTDVRKGDTVEVAEDTPDGRVAWRFVVANVTDRFGTGPCIVPPQRLMAAGGWHCSVFTMPNPLTLTLLDRPKKRGPQYSAITGDRFVDPSGAICVRTDQPDPIGDFPRFMIVTGNDRGCMVDDTEKIAELVPYGTPNVAEHDRLCADVIEAGRQWLIGPRAHLEKPLGKALEALRNYERRDQP